MEKIKNLLLRNPAKKRLPVFFRLRKYRPGDEEGIIDCIRDEYRDTYFKKELYHPEYIRRQAEEGHIIFLVAQTVSGKIAGILLLKRFEPKESMCEIASQIFRKKYRGYGLAEPFFDYGMEVLFSFDCSAAYCLPVVFHDITQRLLGQMGLRAVGFILNVFDLQKICHSFPADRNTKHSQGVQVMALEKRDAGSLYIPTEQEDFCRSVYESLKVTYKMKTAGSYEDGESFRTTEHEGEIEWKEDEVQSSLEIRIHRVGADLPARLRQLHRAYPLTGRRTANVFLNINDSHAVWAYELFQEEGYFFTGYKPLCSEREYMILHNPGEIQLFLEDYTVSEEFKKVLDYVKIQWKKRRIKETK